MGSIAGWGSDVYYEYLIIGAGPAGVQMAYFLEKAGRSYLVLESGDSPGTFFLTYPRHRTLISINKRYNYFPEDEYNLRHDWNSLLSDNPDLRFTKYSDKLFPHADDYVRYIKDFVDHYRLNIQYQSRVVRVSKGEGGRQRFEVETEGGTRYKAGVVFMACGAMKERVPDIPGINLADTYGNHSLDLEQYVNKRVAIVGGANSAFETADYIAGHAAYVHMYCHSPIKMAWDSHFPGHLRAINNSVIDMTHLKSLHAIREADITKLEKVMVPDGEDQVKMYFNMPCPNWSPPGTGHFFQTYDKIIYCTGWKYVLPEMFDKTSKPEVCAREKLAVLNDKWESSVENLYFIGTCMQQRDMRAASPFIHGFRYGVRSLHYLLEHQRHQVALPHQSFSTIDLQELAVFMLKRFSTNSALYQLNYGVLCDLLVFDLDKNDPSSEEGHVTGKATYYYELPGDWTKTHKLPELENAFFIIMKDHKKRFPGEFRAEFDFARIPDLNVSSQPCSAFIQPVIYRYRQGELVEEFSMGSSPIVRVDKHVLHGDNNPQRNANKLKNLMCRQFGKECPYDETLFGEELWRKSFTPWTEEEKKNFVMKKEKMMEPQPCHFDLKPAPIIELGELKL